MTKRFIIFLIAAGWNSMHPQEGHWQVMNGPYAGVINSISRPCGNEWFFGTSREGIWRSNNLLSEWHRLAGDVRQATVRAVITTGDGTMFAASRYEGVYVSTDNGHNWYPFNTGLTNFDIMTIMTDSAGFVFAGTRRAGLFRCTGPGSVWQIVNQGLNAVFILSLVCNINGDLYCGTAGQGVFRSTDHGESWEAVNSGIDNKYIWSMAVIPDGSVLAGSMGTGLYKTVNHGALWEYIGLGPEFIYSLDVHPQGYIAAGTDGSGAFISSDGGRNWTNLFAGLTNKIIWSIRFLDSDRLICGTDGDGLFEMAWPDSIWRPKGIPDVPVLSLAALAGEGLLAGTEGKGLFWFSANGLWKPLSLPDSSTEVTALLVHDHYWFAGTRRSGIYRSDNNGLTWITSSSDLPNTVVTKLMSYDGVLLAGTYGYGMYVSTNNGQTWQVGGLTNEYIGDIGRGPSGHLMAGLLGKGVYQSTDNGLSWHPAGTGMNNPFVYAISYINGYLFAGTDGGIYRSTDNGSSWHLSSSSFYKVRCMTALVSGVIFAGTDGQGVLYSGDSGNTWSVINDGLPDLRIYAMAHNGATRVYAGTCGSSVCQLSLTEAENTNNNFTGKVRTVSIQSVFPNPFNASATIRYFLAVPSRVEIKIFNMLGQEVVALFNGTQPRGNHTVYWDGKNSRSEPVSGGLYIGRIQSAFGSDVKKILVVK